VDSKTENIQHVLNMQ